MQKKVLVTPALSCLFGVTIYFGSDLTRAFYSSVIKHKIGTWQHKRKRKFDFVRFALTNLRSKETIGWKQMRYSDCIALVLAKSLK